MANMNLDENKRGVKGAHTYLANELNVPGVSKVTEFFGMQVTGVTVTDDGRIFACFPRWREGVPVSVVEIAADGSYLPYPNELWNQWTGSPKEDAFTCIQSVIAHKDSLFVLDPANPMMKGVVGNARLFEFDLSTNRLKRKWDFSSDIAPKKSYLNDLRVDELNQQIYITDSGIGAIVILDLKTGLMRRVFEKAKATRAEWRILMIKGKPFLQNMLPARMHSDGIALADGYLYFHALTGYHLYRVPTSALLDDTLTFDALETRIEDLGQTPAPDGMIFDQAGNLYMADLESGAIMFRTPSGEMKTLLQSDKLGWADTFALSREGELYFTDSHLMDAKPGEPADGKKFEIYKIKLQNSVH